MSRWKVLVLWVALVGIGTVGYWRGVASSTDTLRQATHDLDESRDYWFHRVYDCHPIKSQPVTDKNGKIVAMWPYEACVSKCGDGSVITRTR